MAFNGSGSFSLASGNPVVTGTTISSTWANNTLTDIATGLSTTVCKDGQQTITANLPMAGFRHTGVGNATTRAAATYASAADLQDGTLVSLTSIAGTNTITATAAITMTAYASGQSFRFIPANTNIGATTLNLNSIGAKNIFSGGAACVGGEIIASVPVVVIYDGTQFNLDSSPFQDNRPLVVGSVDRTKKVRLEVDGLTTATTRVITVPDVDLTLPYKPGTLGSVQIFSANGTYTAPTGLVRAVVEVQGAGGGSGGCGATGAGQWSVAAGGAAGGYTIKTVSAATIGASQTVTIGSAGSAGNTTPSGGGTGGTSSFGAILSATGGAGGAAAGVSATAGANGPLGGVGSSGDVNVTGAPGGPGFASNAAGLAMSGFGGSSRFGGGGLGLAGVTGAAANAATGFGAGGGSGYQAPASGGTAGAVGTAGLVIVWEYF